MISLQSGRNVSVFNGYTKLWCVGYTYAIFIGIKNSQMKLQANRLFSRTVNAVCKYSLSIYLLQYFVFYILTNEFNLNVHSFWYVLIVPIVVVICCITASFLLRKLKIFRIMLP